MASAYRVQIVDVETGQVVHAWAPGMVAEAELLDNVLARVRAKGVGLGRTTTHVMRDVGDAWRELLWDLKVTVPPKHV